MDTYLIVIIAVCAVVALFLLCMFVIAGIALRIGTGCRFDKRPYVRYFTPEDFHLPKDLVEFKDEKGIILRGGMYGVGKDTIILLHGMGPGNAAYTKEIDTFVSWGYKVLAVDYRGCNDSDGKTAGSFQAGIDCAKMCVDYVKKNFCGKIFLFGHSWGAYTALCTTKYRDVDGVVAVSAPDGVASIYTAFAQRYVGKGAAIILPFIYVDNFFVHGPSGNVSASKCADRSSVPILVIQGSEDYVVPYKASAYRHIKNPDVKKLLCEHKRHSPFNTTEAEDVIADVNAILMKGRKLTKDDVERLKSLDYDKSVEEDSNVMSQILNFYKSI